MRVLRWVAILTAGGVSACGAERGQLAAYVESCDPSVLRQPRSCNVQSPPTWVPLQPGQAIQTTVDAVCRRNPTGALLEVGAEYEIQVTAMPEPWKDAWVEASPATGWSGMAGLVEPLARLGAVFSDAPVYALLGQVELGTVFHVGMQRKMKSAADGRLYLFANDWPIAYTNNRGCLQLRIARAQL